MTRFACSFAVVCGLALTGLPAWAGTTERVGADSSESRWSAISADGRYVTFESDGMTLGAGQSEKKTQSGVSCDWLAISCDCWRTLSRCPVDRSGLEP